MNQHIPIQIARIFTLVALILTIATRSSLGLETPSNAQVNPGTTQSATRSGGWPIPENPTPKDFFDVRGFEEALVPVGNTPTSAENREFAKALRRFFTRTNPEDYSALTAFVEENPKSPWVPTVLLNLGLAYL